MFTSASSVAGNIYSATTDINSYFNLKTENQALVDLNRELVNEVESLKRELRAFEDSASVAGLQQQLQHHNGFHYNTAKVVNNSVNKVNNYITIDKGTLQGVGQQMGVFNHQGVIGITYTSSDNFTIVLPLLNSKSSVSCKVQGSNDLGYLRWNGGDARYGMLHDLPRYSSVAIGDTIVTSGNSTFFPEGILVGKAEELYPSSDGLSMTLKVALSAQFSQLERVFIMRKMDAEELGALKESLNPKKKKK